MDRLPFDGGKSIGQVGSESGIIIRDEEHIADARISLERGGQVAPFSITCGIHGWMVHARFFRTEAQAQSEFQHMRSELTHIIGKIPLMSDPQADEQSHLVIGSISEFTSRFP